MCVCVLILGCYVTNKLYATQKQNSDIGPEHTINNVLVGPFRYDYSRATIDIPLKIILNKEKLQEWKNEFREGLLNDIFSLPAEKWYSPVLNIQEVSGRTYSLYRVRYAASDGAYKDGGVLAIPKSLNPRKPMVVALHGHEEPVRGKPAVDNFMRKDWMHEMAAAGYIVFAPIAMEHQMGGAERKYGYPFAWVRRNDNAITSLLGSFKSQLPHKGLVVMGLSSGGLNGYVLMAIRDDIIAGIFAGASGNLDFYRREYRIPSHPDCWDIYMLRSYLPVLALLAPRPVMFLDGIEDPFYPKAERLQPQKDFSGTTRGVLTEEYAGGLMLLRQHWGGEGGPCFAQHDGGHELIADMALRFMQGERSFCQ